MSSIDSILRQGDIIWCMANLLRGPYRSLEETGAGIQTLKRGILAMLRKVTS